LVLLNFLKIKKFQFKTKMSEKGEGEEKQEIIDRIVKFLKKKNLHFLTKIETTVCEQIGQCDDCMELYMYIPGNFWRCWDCNKIECLNCYRKDRSIHLELFCKECRVKMTETEKKEAGINQ